MFFFKYHIYRIFYQFHPTSSFFGTGIILVSSQKKGPIPIIFAQGPTTGDHMLHEKHAQDHQKKSELGIGHLTGYTPDTLW